MNSIIKVSNLNKIFKEKKVLDDLNFNIEKGQMVALTGKSGRGKSTILNILGLITEKTSGNLLLFGKKNVGIHSKEALLLRRDKIGYLFQNYGLVEDESVYWNLNLALEYKKLKKKDRDSKIKTVLKKIGLENEKKQMVYKLSGGEQQRVALARILLQESELVLADEPTGSLDSENRDIVLDILMKMKENGKTIVIVTHDPFVAEQCDYTIAL